MTNMLVGHLMSPNLNKETVAFERYADFVEEPEYREKLQFPRGEPLQQIDVSKELFRVQKPSDHWE